MTQLTSQLVDQKIASSDVERKVASNTIRIRINDRETDTTIVVQRRIVVETWVVLHPDLVVTKLDKDLECSKLDSLRSGRSITAPRGTSVSAGIRTGAQSNHCVILIH